MSYSPAVDIKGLKKKYGTTKALRGVNLQVKKGEILGFLGPNGAGKTTTIRCLLDLIRPDAGQIRILGRAPRKDSLAIRRRTGYLPGELNLEGNLTVNAALRYFYNLRGLQGDWKYVQYLAKCLDLDMSARIKNLSKGNKQKVGLVQALMSKPELLLLDEPTSGLDPLRQQVVYRLLKEAQKEGATIFFSSHIISEVEAIADRVAIIRRGLIVEEAQPGELANMALRRFRVRFCGPVDIGPLSRLPGVKLINRESEFDATVQVEGEVNSFIKALAAYEVSDIQSEHLSLEEVFLAYYKDGKEE